MEKLNILVVDDESKMRKLLNDFLTKENYCVIEAANGEEAVDIFFNNKNDNKGNIDLVILDEIGRASCRERV